MAKPLPHRSAIFTGFRVTVYFRYHLNLFALPMSIYNCSHGGTIARPIEHPPADPHRSGPTPQLCAGRPLPLH